MPTTILWFRNDLRLVDSPALSHAAERGRVVPVYIHHPDESGDWPLGGASKWWLHHSLASLSASLQKCGSPLLFRRGDPYLHLQELAQQTGADRVVWNRRYEPSHIACDKRLKQVLVDGGLSVQTFNSALLFEPWQAQTKQGKPYQVYSPFRRFLEALPCPDKPLPAPQRLIAPETSPASDCLEDLKLLPTIAWDQGLADMWQPGEQGGSKRLKAFAKASIDSYKEDREFPAKPGSSMLSAHLHFGEVSPRQAYHAALDRFRAAADDSEKKSIQHYISELLWREFAYHLIYHFPHTPRNPLRDKYAAFPWLDASKGDGRAALAAWQKGQTGYPLVDAGMRQLWHTGWMHNRVRMVVASFLVKHLLLDWRHGAAWFWDTLVDADLASNTLGWQWAAGCGADAAPYFRIFNPITQGEKFDVQGVYVKQWCPELKGVPTKYIHKPWECPPLELQAAGVTLGVDYPHPIVDHKQARERALAALSEVTGS